MVDTQLLDFAIEASGKTKSHLAKQCGMTLQTFRRKRLNLSPFTTDQVDSLCKELYITKLSQRDRIFFRSNVE